MDGNCLFRCFAQHLIGNQEKHGIICHLLIQFELLNPTVFKVYLTSNQSASIKEHCRLMNVQNSWGTHVEIIVAATYFHAPVYIHEFVPSSGNWKWKLTKPIKRKDLIYPSTAKSFGSLSHFEISYVNNHYNCIVSKDNHKLPSSPPIITKSEFWVEIL